jgi:large-conductance mechanosensitive channel
MFFYCFCCQAKHFLFALSNTLQDEEPKPTPITPEDIVLLKEIRDLIKKVTL